MAYVGFEQVAADNSVDSVTELTIPAGATGAELQADTNPVRYTMDGTDPSQTEGMVLATADMPREFLVADLRSIKYTRGAASDGNLNVHYFAGRNV